MGYCNACQSAGSVNGYGFCEICGAEHAGGTELSLMQPAAPFDKQEITSIPATALGGGR